MSTVSAASEEPRPAATVGEVYAYRARAVDELVPVRVLKEGTKRPARVLIRFDDPAMEGREEWVPPSRLKARWEDVDDFRAGEARWDAVYALRPGGDSPEANAALMATELVISRDVAEFGDRGGYLEVHDSAALLGSREWMPSFSTRIRPRLWTGQMVHWLSRGRSRSW